MIINHPVLNRFSPAIREVMPEVHDDKLKILPTLQMVALPPEPIFRLIAPIGQLMESSFLTEQNQNVANAAASLLTVANLRPGYWTIDVQVGYRSNFLGTDVSGDYRFLLDEGSGNVRMITIFSAVGPVQVGRTIEVMLSRQATIFVFLNANGVGQDHSALTSIVANKLL